MKGKGFGAIAAGLGIPLIMKLLTGKGRKRRKHIEKRLKGRRVLSNLLKMIGLGDVHLELLVEKIASLEMEISVLQKH